MVRFGSIHVRRSKKKAGSLYKTRPFDFDTVAIGIFGLSLKHRSPPFVWTAPVLIPGPERSLR
jgi:hypothetical protein